jgi:uncharacterized protein (TIGR01777 family)
MEGSGSEMKVVIAGGSGQVGTMLARHFHAGGHAVIVLSRTAQGTPWQTVLWDGVSLGPWVQAIDESDVWINLSGRSVNCRYTPENRKAILDSRVLSTLVLQQALEQVSQPPAVWLNASTATIYRHALDRPMDEATGEYGGDEPGAPETWNFSIGIAKAWEEAFFRAPTPATRKVALRSAMTFSPDRDGVFDVFLRLVRFGLGGTILPGTQRVSWIYEVDFIRAVEFLIAHPEIEGAVNLAAPEAPTNREFLHTLRQAWGIRFGLPTTRWMLEIGAVLLRTESELVLKSRWVTPGRLLQAGFTFEYPAWPAAAEELVARWHKSLR